MDYVRGYMVQNRTNDSWASWQWQTNTHLGGSGRGRPWRGQQWVAAGRQWYDEGHSALVQWQHSWLTVKSTTSCDELFTFTILTQLLTSNNFTYFTCCDSEKQTRIIMHFSTKFNNLFIAATRMTKAVNHSNVQNCRNLLLSITSVLEQLFL